MIERKYSQPAMFTLNQEEIKVAAQSVLARICLVTGWLMPDSRGKINVLVDELALYLQEHYPTINVNEISAAFRQFGTKVKDWGKAVNLGLIEQVLSPYMEARAQASRAIEDKVKELPAAAMPEETPEEKISFAYEHWKRVKNIELTQNVYTELRDTGRMEKPGPELAEQLKKAVNVKRLAHLSENANYFKDIDVKEWSKILLQKLACHNYFLTLTDGLP